MQGRTPMETNHYDTYIHTYMHICIYRIKKKCDESRRLGPSFSRFVKSIKNKHMKILVTKHHMWEPKDPKIRLINLKFIKAKFLKTNMMINHVNILQAYLE